MSYENDPAQNARPRKSLSELADMLRATLPPDYERPQEMSERLQRLRAPKAESVTIADCADLKPENIEAPAEAIRFMPSNEQRDELAPDQIAVIDEAARQDANVELEPIAWEPDQTAGEVYPENYDAAPIQYEQVASAIEMPDPNRYDKPAEADEEARASSIGGDDPRMVDVQLQQQVHPLLRTNKPAQIEETEGAPMVFDAINPDDAGIGRIPDAATPEEMGRSQEPVLNAEPDIVYPAQQRQPQDRQNIAAPVSESVADTPIEADAPDMPQAAPEAAQAPEADIAGSEPQEQIRARSPFEADNQGFDLGATPEASRLQTASYFRPFQGAGLGDPITDAERGIVEPERSPYIEINGEAVTMDEFRALDPAQIRTADISQVDGMQEANLPNCTEFHARDCPDLERLNLPAADRVSVVDCAQLETISAETATQVSARGCDALTEIDAPKADQITVSECPAIEKIQNDNASYVSADDCEKLTAIDTPNARWVSAADCPALESINAPDAERVRAENCNALTDAKVNAPEDAYFKAQTPDLVEAQKPVQEAQQTRAPEAATPAETAPRPMQERSQAYEMTM